MTTEPKSFRETNLVLGGIEARVDLVQKMVWAVIGLLGALVTGAFALYSQIGDLKTDIAVVKTTVATINERLTRIDKSVESVLASGVTASSALSRIEARLSAMSLQQPNPLVVSVPPRGPTPLYEITFTDGEKQLIREFINPIRVAESPAYQIGEIAPVTSLSMLPEPIVAKIPRLTGLRYAVDRGGTILIVDGATYRIAAIIPPI
jgi:hypothetical protein